MRSGMFLALLSVTLVANVAGHGYMAKPYSRNYELWATDPNFGDVQSLAEPLAGSTDVAICGYLQQGDRNFATPEFANEPSQMGWDASEGTLTVKFQLTAHHHGYFEVRLCESGMPTVECFTGSERLLLRTSETAAEDLLPLDPAYPWRYYTGPVGLGWVDGEMNESTYPATTVGDDGTIQPIRCDDQVNGQCFQRAPAFQGVAPDNTRFWAPATGDSHQWKVKVSEEQALACQKHCVLLMNYVTANSCNPKGQLEFFDRADVQARIQSTPLPWRDLSPGITGWYTQLTTTCTEESVRFDRWFATSGTTPEKFWNCADIVLEPSVAPATPTELVVLCVIVALVLLVIVAWLLHHVLWRRNGASQLEESTEESEESKVMDTA